MHGGVALLELRKNLVHDNLKDLVADLFVQGLVLHGVEYFDCATDGCLLANQVDEHFGDVGENGMAGFGANAIGAINI